MIGVGFRAFRLFRVCKVFKMLGFTLSLKPQIGWSDNYMYKNHNCAMMLGIFKHHSPDPQSLGFRA